MKRALIIALILAGCATKPPEPVVRTVRVEVPIPVPCDVKVDRNDVEIAPIIRGASDILARVEILIDAYEYVTAQRDAERAANDACG